MVSRPDRNAGPDDRGLRRSDERRRRRSRIARSGCSSRSKRRTGRRPRHRRRRLRPAAPRRRIGSRPTRWSKSSSATSTSSRKRSRPAPASTSRKFLRSEITPQMSHITLKKTDPGVAWGSVHWQYLEDMSKITPHEGTPLKLTKTLYTSASMTKKRPGAGAGQGPVGRRRRGRGADRRCTPTATWSTST